MRKSRLNGRRRKPSLSADLTESSGAGIAFQTGLKLKEVGWGGWGLAFVSFHQPVTGLQCTWERTRPGARQCPSAVGNAW